MLEDAQILTSFIGWLLHERDSLPSRMALGQTALVSKEWRNISHQTCFWRPLVRELLLVVCNDESLVQRQGYFARLSQCGKCLAEEEVLMGDHLLFDGLETHMEV